MSLEEYRKKIDIIDREILKLYEKRMEVVKDVALYKEKNSIPITNTSREKDVIEKITSNLENKEIKEEAINLFKKIISISKEYEHRLLNHKNIVLIGMPGSGKTSIGKSLAKDLNMKFIDVDEYIEEKEGKSIEELFKNREEFFRSREQFYISKLNSVFNSVISTGGGVVLKDINMENLKRNGIIVFINRPIEEIIKDVDIKQRPLLKNGIDKIYDLYKRRIDLYKKYCDFEIINDDSMQKAKEDIIKIYNKSGG